MVWDGDEVICKMDIDDDFKRARQLFRLKKCRCKVPPIKPDKMYGCLCPKCGKQCKECIGFGFVETPQRKFYEVYKHAVSLIKTAYRFNRKPPGYIRMSEEDVKTIKRKLKSERKDNFIRDYVSLGPPLKVLETTIIVDHRK